MSTLAQGPPISICGTYNGSRKMSWESNEKEDDDSDNINDDFHDDDDDVAIFATMVIMMVTTIRGSRLL